MRCSDNEKEEENIEEDEEAEGDKNNDDDDANDPFCKLLKDVKPICCFGYRREGVEDILEDTTGDCNGIEEALDDGGLKEVELYEFCCGFVAIFVCLVKLLFNAFESLDLLELNGGEVRLTEKEEEICGGEASLSALEISCVCCLCEVFCEDCASDRLSSLGR